MTLAAWPSTRVLARPRFEGSNICSWIGFKHVMYLVEEAVLDHLRQSGFAPRALYEEHGLAVEVVDSDVRILHALHMDDVVRTEVTGQPPGAGPEMLLRTRSYVDRLPGVTVVTATVRLLFRTGGSAVDCGSLPVELAPHTVDRVCRDAQPPAGVVNGRGTAGSTGDLDRLPPERANAIVWRWRIPYFYCHYSERLQHSGYLRVMEEVVDLFLADRGISIRSMLERRRWIPVVPRARVEILREAYLEEELHTVFTVQEVFKDLTYTARMDCYVPRGGRRHHTATGTITHGYAEVLDRRDWRLVRFDEETVRALRGIQNRPGLSTQDGGTSWPASA